MTKTQALYNFFNGFCTAYPITAVPEAKDVPNVYLTYEPTVGNTGDPAISITVNLWYRTTSEALINAKVEQIANAITLGGTVISYDGGTIWVTMGKPWAIPVADNGDTANKRRTLNIDLQFN